MYTNFLNLHFKDLPIKWQNSSMSGVPANNNGLSEYANSLNDSFVKQNSGVQANNNEQSAPSVNSLTKQDTNIQSNFLNLTNKIDSSIDRRIEIIPIASDNRNGLDRREIVRIPQLSNDVHKIESDYKDILANTSRVNEKVNKFDELIHDNKEQLEGALSASSLMIPFRRISSVPDKLENKDYIGTAGVLAVAGLLLPEDLRDTKDGVRHVMHKILPNSIKETIQGRFPKLFDKFVKYSPMYNHKEFQAPFSFIRGSFLEKFVNKNMCNKYGHALYEWDKSLLNTKFGKKIMNLLKVKDSKWEFTGRKVEKVILDEGKYIIDEVSVKAVKLEGSKIGKLICRALNRTTVYGAIALTAICLPSIIKAFNKPANTKDKLDNGGKQTLKSTISVVSALSGIGLMGALFAPFGPAGSVAGMAVGSVIGAGISTKINKNIKTEG